MFALALSTASFLALSAATFLALATASTTFLLTTTTTAFAGAWAVALGFGTSFQLFAVINNEDALAFIGGLFHFQCGLLGGTA